MIEVADFTKVYGQFVAVDRISFKIAKGEIVGLLGPNGAGKTTTIRVLTTFLAPTAGRLAVAGFDVEKSPLEVRRRLGYLPESAPLYDDMRVRDYLSFVAQVRGIPRARKADRLDYVARHCGLAEAMHKPISELSKGYRQRVGLAQALIHDPEIVILDEPTSGLDPNQIVEIRNLIKGISREKTVILSTHILQEVAATCNRIVIIHRGRVVADGTQEQLKLAADKESTYFLSVAAESTSVRDKLQTVAGVRTVELLAADVQPGFFRYKLTADRAPEIAQRIHELVVQNRWQLAELSRRTVALEDVFRSLTREE